MKNVKYNITFRLFQNGLEKFAFGLELLDTCFCSQNISTFRNAQTTYLVFSVLLCENTQTLSNVHLSVFFVNLIPFFVYFSCMLKF